MKIRRFVRDPTQEAANIRASLQHRDVRECGGKLLVGHAGMDDAVTDRMDRHDFRATTAFRYPVMPFDFFTEGPLAQPAPPMCWVNVIRASAWTRPAIRFTRPPIDGIWWIAIE